MTFGNIYASSPFVLSFELFPPKSSAGRDALAANLKRLLAFNPDFVTCTYGAGGTTNQKTLETLAMVRELTDAPLASHLTCVGSTVESVRSYLGKASEAGIENIVAIRGDIPDKATDDSPVFHDSLRYGADLVALIRDEFPSFGIAVGGYPEKHPEAESFESDLDHLKRKVDCGADVVITQLFYDNEDFYRFRDRCVTAGIGIPIVPGLLPVTSFPQIERITSLSGARLPDSFHRALEQCGDDSDAQFQVGVEQATEQTSDLVAHGVPGIHYYVLNKSDATSAVLNAVTFPRD